MLTKIDLSTLEPLYDKKFSCPFCKEAFTSKKVRSRFVKPLRTDSDFGPLFDANEENNPLYYYVIVCPHCGFSFTEDFSKNISQMNRNKIQQEITDKIEKTIDYCGPRDFDLAVRASKLAIYTGQLLQEKHAVMGNLCLRLAWLYRGAGKKEEETRFLQLSAIEFEQSFINTDFNSETTPEMQILYLVGELNRKLGNYQQAVNYFSKVVEHPDRSRYVKYVNLAREQWKIAVEEYREQKDENN